MIASESLFTPRYEDNNCNHREQKILAHSLEFIQRAAFVRPYVGRVSGGKAWFANLPLWRRAVLIWLTMTWQYESFEEKLRNTKLPAHMLDQMPMVQDGRRLWGIIGTFVKAYLSK